ncbi:5-formyltetrahydrofolate cyclo-ligase [Mucilaginibacter koreensis]
MTKKQLRQLYFGKRQQLSVAAYAELNALLLQQFQQLNFNSIRCIHLFLPALERKEPDTFLIRNWLKAHHPHITLVFPKADFANYTMQSYADNEHLQLAVNNFGLTEPADGNLVDNSLIDLIIVPLLAVDRRGYRVGYGKGFYDRFIGHCRPDVRLVGLSFFEPVEAIEDLHEFDVPLQMCVMPTGIYQF